MTAHRSSARAVQRKRYTNDAFDGIEGLQSLVQSEDEQMPDHDRDDDDDDEEDEVRSEDLEDEVESPATSEDEVASDVEELASVHEVSDASGVSDAGDDGDIVGSPTKRRKKERGGPTALYMRGLPDYVSVKYNKLDRRLYHFGPTKADYSTIEKARSRWGAEFCFPSRKAYGEGQGGFAYSDALLNEIDNAEANWMWYTACGGKDAFKLRQLANVLTKDEAGPYLLDDLREPQPFVLGPVGRAKLHTLFPGSSAVLAESFEKSPDSGQKWKQVFPADYKAGFILDLGARVHCLDWAPNQSGPKQYLAVSLLPERLEHEPPEAPAFNPQPAYHSSIQLWEICATHTNVIDKGSPPRLRITLCMSIGDIKSFKWCPVPCQVSNMLGLLGIICGDGAVRIIEVPSLPTDTSEPIYTHISSFAFESRPPIGVFTSFTWLSSSCFAVSDSNGFVALFDLLPSLHSTSPPRPSLYVPFSTSYIMALASGYPSFPNMLMATSMNGYLNLTDILRPPHPSGAGTTLSHRMRIGQSLLGWSEFGKCGLSVEDNLIVRAYPLRRWFTSIGVGRLKSHATVLATSPCHPFVLFGTAAGEVLGNSPLRRVVDGGKTTIFQQFWFVHEWRKGTPEQEAEEAPTGRDKDEGTAVAADPTATGLPEHPPTPTSPEQLHRRLVAKRGLSRFVEGFRAEKTSVTPRAGETQPNSKHGMSYTTIYEEKTAITALAWNPNVHVGGWAAAGMADGLLRIEDIAG